ncbi:MAG: DUF4339 domain-containing protein [Candidatus Cryptobacteroides sp.]
MKPLDFNTLNTLNQSDPSAELMRQAQNSIKAMQVDVPQVGIPSHVVLPIFQGKDENQYVLAVGQEQKGPYTVSQLNQMLREGSITVESFVWRSGMSEWKMIKDCPDIIK